MRYIIILTLIFSFCSITGQENGKKCYKNISPKEFSELISKKNSIIIDVRLLKEYEKSRILNSYLASNSKILNAICKEIDEHDIILIYCRNGERSKKAAGIICSNYLFKYIYNLKGGLENWEKQGFPIDKSKIDYE